MKTVVLKFGGTSVGNIERIKKVAQIIAAYKKRKRKVIVVSSAMSGTTNELIKKSKKLSNNFNLAEYDVLLASGEQIACSLIAGRLIHLGIKSRTWLAWQIPIFTSGPHKNSRINSINKNKIFKYLKDGGVPIIAGFQGINNHDRVTTIGRGGSDASAIMLSKFLKAEKCIIYTDVEGVFTTDPNKFKKAKKIKVISYEEMLEMASLGAKVMQPISIQDARLNRVNIDVKSSFKNTSGTLITKKKGIQSNKVIRGITFTKNDAKITLVGVKDKPGVAADVFEPMGKNNINIDMVIQNTSLDGKTANITFTIKQEDLSKTLGLIEKNKEKLNYNKITHDDKLAKVSIIGAGMISESGVTYKMFRSLAEEKINILAISTSEIKLSVIINEEDTVKAIKKLHTVFDLD